MQTALHIYHIVTTASRELIGAEFIGSEFYRKERLACMFFKRKGGKKMALALRFHPTANGLLFLPAGKLEITTGEKPFPFFQEHYGATVSSFEHLGFDRVAKLSLSESGQGIGSIIAEALGPSGNLWFLNASGEKSQVLRNRDFGPNDVYELPGGAGARVNVSPNEVTAESLLALCKDNPERYLVDLIDKNIAGFQKLLANEVVSRANLSESLSASDIDTESAEALLDSIAELIDLSESGQSGYMYNSTVIAAAFPFKLKSADEQAEKFQTYSLAELALMRSSKAQGAEEDQSRSYKRAINGALKRQRRSIGKMRDDLSEYENFERHKQFADLLKANLGSIKRGMESVTLEDLYLEGEITIKLDSKLSPVDNANAYYKKYQKGKLGLDLLQRRLQNSELEQKRLENIAEAFENDADGAQMRFADELAALLRHKEAQQTGVTIKAPRMPYRTYLLTTGLTVYVGRDGTDNDDTTFKHIKPYELWFHASQCPGSHVGLKFPAKTFIPSKTEIEETAAIAAWFSKARKNKIAPVNYTERKYVRKPRKAKAGLVTIEREKTVMIQPKEPTAN